MGGVCDHDWDFTGGCQCPNERTDREQGYFCSRPVYQCTKCLTHDNGKSEAADRHCSKCPGRKSEKGNGAQVQAVCTFSCIGHHALGLARAGIGTVAFCEIDPWRRERIAEEFPGIPVHDDIRTFQPPAGHIIIGGPPCKGTSAAAAVHGRRTNASLWPYLRRAWVNMGRKWLVVEQPPGNAAWEAKVADDIRRLGGHCARVEFEARDVGAPYQRRRVFILASLDRSRLESAWQAVPSAIERVKGAAAARGDWCPDHLAAIPVDARRARENAGERKRWIAALGDSNPPHMAEVIGHAIVAAEQG